MHATAHAQQRLETASASAAATTLHCCRDDRLTAPDAAGACTCGLEGLPPEKTEMGSGRGRTSRSEHCSTTALLQQQQLSPLGSGSRSTTHLLFDRTTALCNLVPGATTHCARQAIFGAPRISRWCHSPACTECHSWDMRGVALSQAIAAIAGMHVLETHRCQHQHRQSLPIITW